MRRRFDFEDFMPQPEILGGRLEAFLSELNARLLKALSDPGSLIGHAWFMDSEGSPIANDDELARVLNNKVIPLLGEWFWDQPESLKLVLGEGALKLVREKGGLLQRRMAGGEVELFLKSFASKGS
jgi:5-methylcytosine-specific restriction protein B